MEVGKEDLDMERELWSGLMEHLIKDNGLWEERMDKEYSLTQRRKYMKENGDTIRLRVMEFILIQMVQNMKDIGIKIFNMEKELKNGLMDQYLLANTEKVRKTELVDMLGQMEQNMKVNGKTMKLLDMVFINGKMVENILVIGEAILWINLDCIRGKMEECMKDFIKMIKSMDMVFIHGPMERNMQDGGLTESNMDLEYLFLKKENANSDCGKTEASCAGYHLMMLRQLKMGSMIYKQHLKIKKKACLKLKIFQDNSNLLRIITLQELIYQKK